MDAAFGTTMTSVQTALEGMVTTLLPIVGAVAIAALSLWAVPKGIGLVKRAMGR